MNYFDIKGMKNPIKPTAGGMASELKPDVSSFILPAMKAVPKPINRITSEQLEGAGQLYTDFRVNVYIATGQSLTAWDKLSLPEQVAWSGLCEKGS